jgi:hypothetical protein
MISRGKFSAFARIAAVNLLLTVAGVAAIELAFGDWRAAYMPPLGAVVDRTYVYRQNLYEPAGEIVYSRDKYGLRGVHESLSQVQLVTVGGSTTDQRYIADAQTWQEVLRSQTGIAVANAGSDGMSSFGHIVAVSEWLHQVPGFSPKYYLHYLGANDASLSAGNDASDRSGHDSPWLLDVRKRSMIVKSFVKAWLASGRPREVNHGQVHLGPGATEMIKASADNNEIENFIENSYAPNLRKLIALHRKRNESVIFVSQQPNPALVRWNDDDTFVSAQFPDIQRWAVALRLINSATRSVCAEAADICHFSDPAGKLVLEPADFYDLAHLTPSGTHKLGEFLAKDLTFLPRTAGASKFTSSGGCPTTVHR